MDDSESFGLDIFEEPKGYRKEPAEGRKDAVYTLLDGTQLELQLLEYDSLWSNFLWNAGRVVAQHIERNPHLTRDKSILELGAGPGLVSLLAALRGNAANVVVTDYPDARVVGNLKDNVDRFRTRFGTTRVDVSGFLWGSDVEGLLALNADARIASAAEKSCDEVVMVADDDRNRFDLLVLTDLLFNHSEHRKLMKSVADTMAFTRESRAWVYFTPYIGKLDKDKAFFTFAEEFGLVESKTFDTRVDEDMFAKDPGDKELRRWVFGHELRWSDEVLERKGVRM